MDKESDKIYGLVTSTRQLDMSRISSLDSTTFTIKGTAVTFFTALVGFALQQRSRELLCVGIVTTALFAGVDFYYRRVQLVHVERIIEIERYLASEYLNKVEKLKDLFEPFYSNRTKSFSEDYFVPVFPVYVIMETMLIVLSLFWVK